MRSGALCDADAFRSTLKAMWENIDSRIRAASESVAMAGKFDDAIFAAFRFIEGEIQEKVTSKSIGQQLLDEAFDGHKPIILLSSESRDQIAMKSLFVGALGNIRNDRGHKKAPAIPCESMQHCFYYLSFASLLLHLLNHDKNTYPQLESVRVFGTPEQPRAELRGANFTSASRVLADGSEANVVSSRPELLEIMLPPRFHGNLQVVNNDKTSAYEYCSVEGLFIEKAPWYEVIISDLPLFADSSAKILRKDIVGVVLRSGQSFGFEMVIPTYPGRYKAGQFVSHGPAESEGVDETWYIRPPNTMPELAFSSSLIITPAVLGSASEAKLGGIAVRPAIIKTEIGENRAIRVFAWLRAGTVTIEKDVTAEVKWKNPKRDVAFIEKGIVRPKSLGKTITECRLQKFVASVEVNVENVPRGFSTIFFQGLRSLQQIRFDADDNLYVTNQSSSVFRISSKGEYSEILRLPAHSRAAAVIDSVAVDRDRRLYVNHVTESTCHRFEWNGKKYINQRELGSGVIGTKKSIAVDEKGNVFIVVMSGVRQTIIIRIDPNGVETHFSLSETAVYIAVDKNEQLYIPLISKSVIGVYTYSGKSVSEIPYFLGSGHSPSDITVSTSGDIYLPVFHTGQILHIGQSGSLISQIKFLPGKFGAPGGLAFDSRGRMFVSNFEGNEIYVVY